MCVQTVNHCKSLIEKDDATRKELGLEILSFSELRQYKRIRDSVNEDAIWLPGKRMTGGFDRRSFVDEDEEDERYDPFVSIIVRLLQVRPTLSPARLSIIIIWLYSFLLISRHTPVNQEDRRTSLAYTTSAVVDGVGGSVSSYTRVLLMKDVMQLCGQ